MQGNFPDKLEAITELGSQFETTTMNSRSRVGTMLSSHNPKGSQMESNKRLSNVDQTLHGTGT